MVRETFNGFHGEPSIRLAIVDDVDDEGQRCGKMQKMQNQSFISIDQTSPLS